MSKDQSSEKTDYILACDLCKHFGNYGIKRFNGFEYCKIDYPDSSIDRRPLSIERRLVGCHLFSHNGEALTKETLSAIVSDDHYKESILRKIPSEELVHPKKASKDS